MGLPRLKIAGREVGVEGLVIFGAVSYETVALATNAITQRRTIPPITDMLGPLTHHKFGKIGVWLFMGWCWDHFWKRGERDFIEQIRGH